MIAGQTALVLLELQNDFLAAGGKLYPLLAPVLEANNVIGNLNRLIRGARSQGMLVVQAPIGFSEDYREMGPRPYGILEVVRNSGALVRGTWGAEIASSINRHDNDVFVEGKSGIDAFAGTDLDYILMRNQVRNVVLAGQLTNICVESTMRSAYDRGYDVIGITDASATVSMEHYRMSVNHNWPMFSRPMTQGEFLETYQRASAA